ncbi:MAG: UvrD-helicase domain-containing protein [Bacteroidales bacterium]|nr:UvrD-helicase domain-containing protein [Bacteroidales bacterium]
MDEILLELNEAQREAAACIEGPVMIIAGAGSGKTRTLTYRIAHLINEGVDPFHILALTFTNKAAAEMRERIKSLVGPEARNIWMGTFHSIFARILRSEADKLGYTSSFTIYDTDDSKAAIRQIVKTMNLDPKAYPPNAVLNRISMAKSSLMMPTDYAANVEIMQADKAGKRPMIAEIYQQYNTRLHHANAMDFDDLLVNVNILLRDFPEVLVKYQNRFQHILVDEYQDTNYSQYLIVKRLAARHQNICVVGDDAQSIYAFRGANIENILNFKRDYPTVRLFKLEQNYRSTRNIVNAANSIIAQNQEQIKKEIWTDNGEGTPIRLLHAMDERQEGRLVAEAIETAHLADDLDYKDFAILYRTNSQSRSMEEALRKMSIPYRIYQGISFYGRKEIKDVLAYMRLVVNNHDDESLLRIINYPSRGIGATTLDKIRTAAADNDISIWTALDNLPALGVVLGTNIMNKIDAFVAMIRRFTALMYTTDAYTLGSQIVHNSGILRLLKEDEDPDNPNRIENIEELLNGIQEFCEKEDDITPDNPDDLLDDGAPDGLRTLDRFLQQVLLLTTEDKTQDDPNTVSLMTIHAAKGLEFPQVFVVGMEENLFPSALTVASRRELEEERRLFYVAVTRAMKQLTLSYATTRYQYGQQSIQELSRFVEEIDPRYIVKPQRPSAYPKAGTLPRAFPGLARQAKPSYPRPAARTSNPATSSPSPARPTPSRSRQETDRIQIGTTVRHEKFGTGKVTDIETIGGERRAKIFFEEAGEKVLLLKYAKLQIITDED